MPDEDRAERMRAFLRERLEGNVWTGTYLDHGRRFRDRWQRVEKTEVR